MTDIYIPFSPEMKSAVVRGEKICTFRFKRYGRPGDTLISPLYTRSAEVKVSVVLRTQVKAPVGRVARYLWKHEGLGSPQEFIDLHIKIQNATRARWGHPKYEYNPDREGWVHWIGSREMPRHLLKKIGAKIPQKQLTLDKRIYR